MRVVRTARRIVAITLAWCLLASSAFAAPPDAGPEEIRRVEFEVSEPDLTLEPIIISGDPEPTAFWGYSTPWGRGGSRGLWCAGSSGATTQYPKDTGGRAILRMDELSAFFEAQLQFWYLFPTAGAADTEQFIMSVARIDAAGKRIEPSVIQGEVLGLSSTWTSRTFQLGAGNTDALSRHATGAWWQFRDLSEGEGLLSKQGQGPAIDDVVLTGYRFGPVRSLTSTWSASPAGVSLSWAKPATSATNSSEDTRTISYRVWRAAAGADTWTELTAGDRAATTSLLDTTAQNESAYDYVVQAWEPGSGIGRGRQSAPLRVFTPGAAPIAEADSYSISEDETLSVAPAFGVLANDSGSGALSGELLAGPAHGALTFGTDGSFTYVPAVDFNGIDEFVYRASEGALYSQPTTVTITVSPVADPTALTVTSASRTLSKYGDYYTFTGRLTKKGASVAGQRVYLQSASSSTGTFSDTGVSVLTGAGGSFSLRHLPRSRTYYRVRFAGLADEYLPTTSAVRSALPRALVGTPVAPKTMYRNRSTRVYGSLKPQHSSGTVRLYLDRYVNGVPKRYAVVSASVSKYSSYSRYSRYVKLPYKGKWRIRAYHADTGHAASWSGTRYVTVR